MYSVDQLDRVSHLTDTPRPEVGAPCPLVFAEEHNLVVAYWIQASPNGDQTDALAVVRFHRPILHMFGLPDENAIFNHPLADRGLAPHDVFQVMHSSWIRQTQVTTENDGASDAAYFANHAHFIFAFHDSTFECIAESFTVNIEQVSQPGDEYALALRALKPRD